MLTIENLYASYKGSSSQKEKRQVLKNINLKLKKGEALGIVGESGSGKSTLANCIIGLKEYENGNIKFQGKEIDSINSKTFKKSKNRKEIQMVFQDPYSSLNPKFSIGRNLEELLIHHKICDKSQIKERSQDLLSKVRLDSSFLNKYPTELSGGQLQRVSIARALASQPSLILLDEPTSALDLLIQKDIINLLENLKNEFNLTYIFISHDLKVVKHICNRVIIIKDGIVVEEGDTIDVFEKSKHPYTKKLINSIPRFNPLP